MKSQIAPSVLAAARLVRLAVFDVDGVLTDGRLWMGPTGEEYKQFHVRDGHGLVMLRETGVQLAIITGRDSPVVARRMEELGITYVYQGCRDKIVALQSLQSSAGVQGHEICYVGDDLPDLPVMRRVGMPVAVADAHPALSAIAVYQTLAPGGVGAAREIAELIMHAQGTLQAAYARWGAPVVTSFDS